MMEKIKIFKGGGFKAGSWKCKPIRKPNGKASFQCVKGKYHVQELPFGDAVEIIGKNCKKRDESQVMCDV